MKIIIILALIIVVSACAPNNYPNYTMYKGTTGQCKRR